MSSAGMGGMGDTDTTDPFGMRNASNLNGMPSEREMAGDTPLGTDPTLGGELPPDTVEVVEGGTGPGGIPRDALYGLDMYAGDGPGRAGGFRVRFVPRGPGPP